MKKQISPSVMCVDFFKLKETIEEFEKLNIDYLHVDIMDGHFVGNYTLGTDFVKALKKETTIPLDIHLMVEKPESVLEWFEFGENDYVSVHLESTCHLQKVLSAIRAKGAKSMVAINPATPICMLETILEDIDAVLVMTVNPGFAGQKLVKSTLKKIADLRAYLDENGFENVEIEVDGNVSFENATLMSKAGGNIFVAGTSSMFSKDFSLEYGATKLRESVNV
ncbi:MAG: ribulose-phosphate 3-epimerase [Clostridia bacterium]|nr:ribulose-phosphate 3-epimerase [Clostridia bacterium]